jgi:predicted MPP superfamily phosphohydrolase
MVLALIVVVAIWMLVEPQTLWVVRNTVSSPQVPAAFDGTRIVFLADIHAGHMVSSAHVNRILDKALALKPDIIILGGDYVEDRREGADIFYPAAARLKAPLGVYAVLGNHDAFGYGTQTAIDGLAIDGIRLLDNTSTVVSRGGSTITLSGIEDWGTGHANVASAAVGVSPQEFAVLVSHNPDALAEQLPGTPGIYDLALAGHLHGGQVTLFGLWAPLVPSEFGNKYRTGWHDIGGTPTLVTNGTGVAWMPPRFFAPPQVHLITLRHADTASVR